MLEINGRGSLIWWSVPKTHGIISVNEGGKSIRYFLLQSRILSAPETIRSGQFVKFTGVEYPVKQGLLPLAVGVEISETPFEDTTAGVSSLGGVS